MNKTFFAHIKKRMLVVALLILFLIIVIPVLLNWTLPIETGITVMGLDAWLGFWGSFIGGIFTIVALWLTIEYTSYENEKTRNQALIDSEDTRRINQEENEKLRQNQLDVLKIELNIDKLDRDYQKIKAYAQKAYKILMLDGINNLAQYPNLTYEEALTYELQLFNLETTLLYEEIEIDGSDNEFFNFVLEKIDVLAATFGENLGFDRKDLSGMEGLKSKIEVGEFSDLEKVISSKMSEDNASYLNIKEHLLITKASYSFELSTLVNSYLTTKHEKYLANRKKMIGEKIATIEGDKKSANT